MVLAAQHDGDAAVGVVEDVREEERRAAVGAPQHEVADVGALEHLIAVHEVGERDAAAVRHTEPQRRLTALGEPCGALLRIELAAGAGIARRATGGELAAAADLDLERRAVAGVGATGGLELRERRGVVGAARRLHDDVAVPVETEPAQVVEDPGGELGAAAGGVRVLDAQQETPGATARQQPVEERGARVAEVQFAGR